VRRPVLVPVLVLPSLLCLAGLVAGCSSADEPTAADTSAAPSATPDEPKPAEFRYTVGVEGPDHWAELSPGYAECADATSQSPIDLTGAVATDVGDPVVRYVDGPVRLTNTGHSVQLTPQGGSTLEIDGHATELQQIHMHEPAEHTVDGVRLAGELHLVHKDADGQITVLAVLLEEGAENQALAPYLAALPREVDATTALDSFDVTALLPPSLSSYRYTGSLTTPPCTEGVQWVVLQQPVEVSTEQLAAFRDVVARNNRPVQPVGDRELVLDGADG
jgi:carbonic anhydrase